MLKILETIIEVSTQNVGTQATYNFIFRAPAIVFIVLLH